MKLLPRIILGFVLGVISGAFTIYLGFPTISGLVFLFVWGIVIWVFSDEFLKNQARKRQFNIERKSEEKNWRRRAYHEARGRQLAERDYQREERQRKFEEKYPLGYPSLSRGVLGKRSKL